MGFIDGISTFTKGVGQKAKGNYDIVSMNNKITGLQKEIQKTYLKMGQQYYLWYKENPAEELKVFVESIKDNEAEISKIKREIENIKAETAAVQLTASTPSLNADGSNGFCTECGAPLVEDSSFCVICGAKLS